MVNYERKKLRINASMDFFYDCGDLEHMKEDIKFVILETARALGFTENEKVTVTIE